MNFEPARSRHYDEMLAELLMRYPDMPTRQLCQVLSEHGCHWSLTAVRRRRAAKLSKRPSSDLPDDFGDDCLTAASTTLEVER